MKTYIIAAYDNVSIARKLLKDVRSMTYYAVEQHASSSIHDVNKEKIWKANIILVLIDENFSNSIYLNKELQFALDSVSKNRNQTIIPIVIGNTVVPNSLANRIYISCKSKSDDDIYWAKRQLDNFLVHSKDRVKQREKINSFNSRTRYLIILTLAIELFAMFFVVLFFEQHTYNIGIFEDKFMDLTIGVVSIIMAVTALCTSYLSVIKRRWHDDEEEEIEAYSRRLKRAIVLDEKEFKEKTSGVEENKIEIDALGRMMINLEDIKEFYTWSQKQAKASFILAVAMCISGFILMIAAIILPIIFKLNFEMSIIPAIGGVITELIAGTALIVYRNSLMQLNHYHKALHEDERFLSSVNLIGKFSTTETQDEMLKEIIRSEIQMNLLGLSEGLMVDEKKNKKEAE